MDISTWQVHIDWVTSSHIEQRTPSFKSDDCQRIETTRGISRKIMNLTGGRQHIQVHVTKHHRHLRHHHRRLYRCLSISLLSFHIQVCTTTRGYNNNISHYNTILPKKIVPHTGAFISRRRFSITRQSAMPLVVPGINSDMGDKSEWVNKLMGKKISDTGSDEVVCILWTISFKIYD